MMELVLLQGDGEPELSLPDEGRARSCPSAKQEESSHQKRISLNLDLEQAGVQNYEECTFVVKSAQSRDGQVVQWLNVGVPLQWPRGSQVQIPGMHRCIASQTMLWQRPI